MGGIHSEPLAEIRKEDVARRVISLGAEYQDYALLVDDNGIDGDLLGEMDEAIFLETLDDIGLDNRTHRAKLLQEFHKCARGYTIEVQQQQQQQQHIIQEVTVGRHIPQEVPSPLLEAATTTAQRRDSTQHPSYHVDHPNRATTEAEQAHLAPNFFQKLDTVPEATRPPIAKDDMDRVALVESYRLQDIEPDSDIAQKLVGLVQMAMNLFDVDLGDITFLNHECQYSLARVGLTEPMEEAIIDKVYDAINYSQDGKPFLCKTSRSIGICNFPTYSGQSFLVPDIEQDIAFQWMRVVWPFRCYLGAPLLTASGVVFGTLCMHSLEPREDLNEEGFAVQLEQVANMVVQSIENWKLRRNINRLETTRLSLQTTKNKSKPPQDKAVAVFTGVEECETLEGIAPALIQDGVALYHQIAQQLREEYFGYEVSRRGPDGLFLVFHDAVDAFGFALDLQQQLFDANWSPELLALPRVGDNGSGFRGLRVKVGAYMGDVTAIINRKTGAMEYQSVKSCTIGIAKNLYEMAAGGQILTIFDTWNVASFLAETKLFSPQVVDLGSHVIKKGKSSHDGVISERIVQLVPAPLASDFSEMAKLGESYTSFDLDGMSADLSMDASMDLGRGLRSSSLWGRQFPDIKSEKKLSPSFYDAPGVNASGKAKVTIAFISTSEIEKRYKEAAAIVSRIIGLASSALTGTSGYQCQNNMLAFSDSRAAINFGLGFFQLLKRQQPLPGGVNLSTLVSYGCVHDSFITLEPHKTTGRADYFGKVVNRAARVAYSSAVGTVCVGETITPGYDPSAFKVNDPKISVHFVGYRKLKGVDGEVAVFKCKRIKNVLQQ
ncbi:Receptor-type adenylate cyclase [Seminavis robusta]|uniref:Receptor-type adenylate cyclase n=1 Tax=Seminavis robusta TaxID=568900 RepID=A0A9N8H6A7_9STRA|nr:Receptor-type adenylate cyclase [Seminavis robusta]|eukprot:Sro107_g053730.1 Receptor-type adenylate cyclase (832) ;mRNA; r:13826-16321